jgi:ribulose-5-phosphate 4-epimerase/fuculose-1-phosphate aldolase
MDSAHDVTESEWKTRCDLAALYRLLDHFRMTDLIYTHISARVPGDAPHFLINEYGMLFHEARASALIKIDLDGAIVHERDRYRRVNTAGFTIHSAIHAARPDLAFVIHTHTEAGAAVAAQKGGLLPISQQALQFFERIGYHDYEGFTLDLDERARLVRDLGPHKAMILRNHGLLVGGRTAAEAFSKIYLLERACAIQARAMAGGAALAVPPEAVCRLTSLQGNPDELPEYEEIAWRAALRLISNEYRT